MPTFHPRPARAIALSLALALAAAACASGARAAAGDEAPPARGNRDLITAEEIRATSASNAYQAVEALRPTFLRGRGAGLNASLSPSVYVNGQRWGDVESLRNIVAADVLTIRRLNAADAQTRYGMDNVGGVIDVATRRGGRP